MTKVTPIEYQGCVGSPQIIRMLYVEKQRLESAIAALEEVERAKSMPPVKRPKASERKKNEGQWTSLRWLIE
jgi:hypothetical protein